MGIPNYDAWKLAAPDSADIIGTCEGDPCNRMEELDEDAPRGYRPTRCDGTIVDNHGELWCDECGGGA